VTQSSALTFPWWIVIILGGLGIGLLYIFLNPTSRALYSSAFWFILPGVWLTLRVTVLSYAIALVVGLVIGLMRLSTNPVFFHLSRVYVEVMRGLPLLVVVLYAGFVIGPWVRDATNEWLDPPMLSRAIVGLGLGYGAYVSEVFRSGIQSIGKGQSEAARSLGMSATQTMRFVILPQAFRIILPPLGNDLVALLKDSSLIAVLALEDILQLGRQWISRTFRALEGYNTVAFLYLVLTMTLSVLVAWIERRTRTGR
jgi:His/Glu/Gln/Arg/opine family amino acid ABC transporter permease subunit